MASVLRQRGVSIVALEPAYDALEPGALESLAALIEREVCEMERPLVVADLSQTSYLDSALIGVFFSARQRILRKNGRLALCGAQPNCADVLEVIKAGQIVEIFRTRDEAVRSLEASATGGDRTS